MRSPTAPASLRPCAASVASASSRSDPYTPRTNGKAERFIQTLLREWAYRRPYASFAARTLTLAPWLHDYNWPRRHSSLHGDPPISRLPAGNLVRLHT